MIHQNIDDLGRRNHFWGQIYDNSTLIESLVASLYHAYHLGLIFACKLLCNYYEFIMNLLRTHND